LIEPGTDRLPYYFYRNTLKKAGKYDEMVATLEDLSKKHPDNVSISSNLAAGYVDAGAKDKAIEQLKKLIAANKNVSWANRQLGDLYKGMDRNEEAAQCYEQSLKTAGFFLDVNLRKQLGDLYVKLGKKTEAQAAYEEYLKAVPSDTGVADAVKTLKEGKLPAIPPDAPSRAR